MDDDRGRPRRDPGRRFGPSAAARGPVPPSGRRDAPGGGDRRPSDDAARRGAAEPRGPESRPARPSTVAVREHPRDRPAPPPAASRTASSGRPDGPAPKRPAPERPAPASAAPPRPPTTPPVRPGRGGSSRPPTAGTERIVRPSGGSGGRVLRVLVTVLSVLVFAVSGSAWAALSGSFSTSGALSHQGTAADGATDILLVGTDSRTDAQGRPLPRDVLASLGAGDADGVLNTDTMMLVRVPNDGSRAVGFSLPRDSYVNIPGRGMGRLNSVYPGAKAAEADQLVADGDSDPADVDVKSSEAGRQALVDTVQRLTGIGVDHYAEINLLGFFNLTNAIGGVNVCLKNAVDDDFSGAHFAAGPRTVQGHDALAFVRQRHGLPGGDLDRVRRQQAFLAGLSNKILSAGTLSDPITLANLLGAVKQSVVLDGNWDLLEFAQQMQGVTGGSVAFTTIPTEGGETEDGGAVLRVDPAEVRQFVADAIGPQNPVAAPAGPAPATIPVDVRNASGTDGAAGRLVQILGSQGYTRITSGNADQQGGTSAVLFGQGGDAGAGVVAKALGGLPTRADPSVPAGSVRVVVARDYRGPGAIVADEDGTSSVAAPPPPQPPITADGIPCVN